nr:MAG TPA: hypothetical protein [Caudoviricetes sp.]
MRKYNFLYESCFNKIMELLEKEQKQYNEFLDKLSISVVPNPNQEGETFYFSPQHKDLTKEKVDKLYEIYKNENI